MDSIFNPQLIQDAARSEKDKMAAIRFLQQSSSQLVRQVESFFKSNPSVREASNFVVQLETTVKQAAAFFDNFAANDRQDPVLPPLARYLDVVKKQLVVALQKSSQLVGATTVLNKQFSEFAKRTTLQARQRRFGTNGVVPSSSMDVSRIRGRRITTTGLTNQKHVNQQTQKSAFGTNLISVPRTPNSPMGGGSSVFNNQMLQIERQNLVLNRQIYRRDTEFQEWQIDFWEKFGKKLDILTETTAKNKQSSGFDLSDLILGGLGLSKLGTGLVKAFGSIFSKLGKFGKIGAGGLLAYMGLDLDKIKSGMDKVYTTITSAYDNLKTSVVGKIEDFKSAVSGAYSKFTTVLDDFATSTSSKVGKWTEAIADGFKAVPAKIQSIMDGTFDIISKTGDKIFSWMDNFGAKIGDWSKNIGSVIGGYVDNIIGAFGKLGTFLMESPIVKGAGKILGKLGLVGVGIDAVGGALYTETNRNSLPGTASITDRVISGATRAATGGEIIPSLMEWKSGRSFMPGTQERAMLSMKDSIFNGSKLLEAQRVAQSLLLSGNADTNKLPRDPEFLNMVSREMANMVDSMIQASKSTNSFATLPPELSKYAGQTQSAERLSQLDSALAAIATQAKDRLGTYLENGATDGLPVLQRPSVNFDALVSGAKKQFEAGGMVSGPIFGVNQSGTTVSVAESGPEAILPLVQGPNGQMGVSYYPSKNPLLNLYVTPKNLTLEMDDEAARELGEEISENLKSKKEEEFKGDNEFRNAIARAALSHLGLGSGLGSPLINSPTSGVSGNTTGSPGSPGSGSKTATTNSPTTNSPTTNSPTTNPTVATGIDPKALGLNYPMAGEVKPGEATDRYGLLEELVKTTSVGETGQRELNYKSQANISNDTNNSRSYGFLGLNSGSTAQSKITGGSVGAFARMFPELGLTANPGTPEFDAQWRGLAASNPEALKKAQLDYYEKKNIVPAQEALRKAGVPENIVNDPRVMSYFADRYVQMGNYATGDADRNAMKSAWDKSGGDVKTFFEGMNSYDMAMLPQRFRSAIASGVYGEKGHQGRLNRRTQGALNINAKGTLGNKSPVLSFDAITQQQDLLRAGMDDPFTPEAERDKMAMDIDRLDQAKLSMRQNTVSADAAKTEAASRGTDPAFTGDPGLGNLKMMNKGATRDKPITNELNAKIQQAVMQVYGEGYTAEVYSGGQDEAGKGGKRTGSTRHDNGKAADLRIRKPDGSTMILKGAELAKFGQFWHVKGWGGVGLEMNQDGSGQGGIHVDQHTDRPNSWQYNSLPADVRQAVDAGRKGVMPTLAMNDEQYKAYVAMKKGKKLPSKTAELDSKIDAMAGTPLYDGSDPTNLIRRVNQEQQKLIDAKIGSTVDTTYQPDPHAAFNATMDKLIKSEIGPTDSANVDIPAIEREAAAWKTNVNQPIDNYLDRFGGIPKPGYSPVSDKFTNSDIFVQPGDDGKGFRGAPFNSPEYMMDNRLNPYQTGFMPLLDPRKVNQNVTQAIPIVDVSKASALDSILEDKARSAPGTFRNEMASGPSALPFMEAPDGPGPFSYTTPETQQQTPTPANTMEQANPSQPKAATPVQNSNTNSGTKPEERKVGDFPINNDKPSLATHAALLYPSATVLG